MAGAFVKHIELATEVPASVQAERNARFSQVQCSGYLWLICSFAGFRNKIN